MTIKKIGFACKISEIDSKNGIVSIPEYNNKSTTIAWLTRQTTTIAEEKLWELMIHNIEAAKKAVGYVGKLNEQLRLFRLGSDILPAYTHADWSYFWQRTDVREYASQHFAEVGDIARAAGVRLSFHPGQFLVLASENPGIVNRSIAEFEYHADMARWMSFGKSFQDFKINVHISGKLGADGVRAAYSRLSPEARNCITIENEENAHGLVACLQLVDLLPIVLDLHHHWIREGEYIQPTDDRVARIIDSWRGVRPVCHYSSSREDYLVDHNTEVMPDYNLLLAQGYKKQKMRAHSDFYWNTACNKWALEFLNTHDIMLESKSKNLGSTAMYKQAKNLGVL
jgi:UV DNA damage endonuclease